LSQAIPKINAHSNIGIIQHVQAIQKNIQNDIYDNLMNILKTNKKAVSFDKAIPHYPQYQSLTLLVNDTVRAFDKVLTHRLLDLHRTNHAFTSTVRQKMRHILIAQHHSTHKHVQSIYTDLQEALDQESK